MPARNRLSAPGCAAPADPASGGPGETMLRKTVRAGHLFFNFAIDAPGHAPLMFPAHAMGDAFVTDVLVTVVNARMG